MGPLPNSRHELFAQGLAKGQKQREAYVGAGFKDGEPQSTAAKATRLAHRKSIVWRVKELLGDVAMITKIEKSYIMSELQKTYDRATQTGDWSACNKSLELMGKELGMFVDRHEVDVQLKRKIIIERLTDEDAALMTALVKKIEAPEEQ